MGKQNLKVEESGIAVETQKVEEIRKLRTLLLSNFQNNCQLLLTVFLDIYLCLLNETIIDFNFYFFMNVV